MKQIQRTTLSGIFRRVAGGMPLFTLLGFFTFVFCTSVFCTSPQVFGQVQPPGLEMDRQDVELRDFHNPEGDVIFTGSFSILERGTVSLFNDIGQLTEFQLKSFSDEDQDYIKEMEKLRRKAERLKEDTQKILQSLDLQSESSIISACNKLKKIGPAAEAARPALSALFSVEEPRVKRAVIIAYIHICERSALQTGMLLHKVNNNADGMTDFVTENPDDFLVAFASFGEIGFPYIRQVACTGSISTDEGVATLDVEPQLFDVSDSERNVFRAAALEALGEYKGEAAVLETLLDLLDVVEQPVNGVRDDASLNALLKSIGELEVVDERATATLERFKPEFESVVTSALARLTRAAEKQQAEADKAAGR